VERGALVLWGKAHGKRKVRPVNGPMLKAKRSKVEEQFNVPELERPPWRWLDSPISAKPTA